MSESVPILKARIDELARANAMFRRQNENIRHLEGLRRLGEQMLDSSGEAIIATDLAGKIIFWNSYAERLYGWRSDEVLGQNVVRIIPAAAAVADAELIMAQLRKGEAWSGEFHVRTRDGREFDVSVTNTPLRDENGKLMGIIGVSSNVTELKRLQQLRKEAEEHNQKLIQDLGERVKELHALTARLNAVREEEALRIARELHDELGQAMTCMTMELAAVQRQLEPGVALSIPEVQERLAGVRRLLDTTIATTRKICTELRPALLDQIGLLPALEAQAEEFEARTGIFCNLTLPAGEIDLTPDAALAVFRIFQEILTNVARHSGATEVTVEFAMTEEEVRLEVIDNGRGVTKAEIAQASGLGLIGMRERALAAGGQVLVESAADGGTRVILSLPRERRAGE